MAPNRWIIGGVIAALAAVAAFFALYEGGNSGESELSSVDLPPGLERGELETVIREYILAHPEIIPEAMDRLQQRRQGQLVAAVRSDLETPFASAWAGAADADVTIVEFFDYACGYCRASLPDVQRLLREDDDLRVVFRELPILSPESETAARVSLAVAQQRAGYFDFHRAMYAAGRPSPETIAEAQREAGVDRARIEAATDDAEIDAELRRNMELARRLELTGTPAFIVGDQVLSGAVGYDRLKQAVEEARAARGA